MRTRTSIRVGNRSHRRTMVLILSVLLFLPPLALLVQSTGDENFCGTWCPRMFFIYRQGTELSAWLLGWLRNWAGVLLLGGMVVSTMLLGRIWCSRLCPVGGALELGSRLTPDAVKADFRKLPAVPIRYGYLAAYLIAPALGIGALTCSYCHFGTVPRLFGAAFVEADLAYFLRIGGVLNLALVLLLGVFARGGRAYCNLLCPMGAIDAVANRLGGRRGRRTRVEKSACTGCSHCNQACPNGAIVVSEDDGWARLNPYLCTSCRACEQVCESGAVRYGKHDG